MADLSGPTPLSVGQFNQVGGNATGIPAASSGLASLGDVIAGAGMQRAQAGALGAQTANTQARTSQITQTQADGQQITDLLANSAGGTDTPKVQQALAIASRNPEIAARIPQMLNAMTQNAAMNHAGPTQAQADTQAAGNGIQQMGGTATGQGLDLANKTQVANIGKEATLGSAGIMAGASEYNERLRESGLDRRTLVMTGVATPNPDGTTTPPVYMTSAQAGKTGAVAYDSPVANTIAGIQNRPVQVANPNGGTTLVPTSQAINQGLTPRMDQPGQPLAAIQQNAVSPPPNAPSTPPQVRAPVEGAQPTGAGNISPEQKQSIADSMVANASGRPPPGASSVQDAAALDGLITTRLKALMPTSFGGNDPSQALLDPIRLQAVYLRDHDPSVRGDWNAAVTQAIQNVTGQNGAGMEHDTHFLTAGPSQLVPKAGAQMVWPPGMAVPAQYRAQSAAPAPAAAPPSALGSVIAGTPQSTGAPPPAAPAPAGPAQQSSLGSMIAGPAQAAAPQAPAPGGMPPPQAMAQLREGAPTTFANGQTWTMQNGKPVRLK